MQVAYIGKTLLNVFLNALEVLVVCVSVYVHCLFYFVQLGDYFVVRVPCTPLEQRELTIVIVESL